MHARDRDRGITIEVTTPTFQDAWAAVSDGHHATLNMASEMVGAQQEGLDVMFDRIIAALKEIQVSRGGAPLAPQVHACHLERPRGPTATAAPHGAGGGDLCGGGGDTLDTLLKIALFFKQIGVSGVVDELIDGRFARARETLHRIRRTSRDAALTRVARRLLLCVGVITRRLRYFFGAPQLSRVSRVAPHPDIHPLRRARAMSRQLYPSPLYSHQPRSGDRTCGHNDVVCAAASRAGGTGCVRWARSRSWPVARAEVAARTRGQQQQQPEQLSRMHQTLSLPTVATPGGGGEGAVPLSVNGNGNGSANVTTASGRISAFASPLHRHCFLAAPAQPDPPNANVSPPMSLSPLRLPFSPVHVNTTSGAPPPGASTAARGAATTPPGATTADALPVINVGATALTAQPALRHVTCSKTRLGRFIPRPIVVDTSHRSPSSLPSGCGSAESPTAAQRRLNASVTPSAAAGPATLGTPQSCQYPETPIMRLSQHVLSTFLKRRKDKYAGMAARGGGSGGNAPVSPPKMPGDAAGVGVPVPTACAANGGAAQDHPPPPPLMASPPREASRNAGGDGTPGGLERPRRVPSFGGTSVSLSACGGSPPGATGTPVATPEHGEPQAVVPPQRQLSNGCLPPLPASFPPTPSPSGASRGIMCRICEVTVPSERVEAHTEVCAPRLTSLMVLDHVGRQLKKSHDQLQADDSEKDEDKAVLLAAVIDCCFAIGRTASVSGTAHVAAQLRRLEAEACSMGDSRFADLVKAAGDACQSVLRQAQVALDTLPPHEVVDIVRLRSSTTPTLDDFHVVCVLARGAFGRIFKAVKKRTNDVYALKVVSLSDVKQRHMTQKLLNERNVMAFTNSNLIVKLHYSFASTRNIYFAMEYYPGGDLFGLLERVDVLSEAAARFYLAEVYLALEHLHSMSIVHRDIKPDNILLSSSGHIKLADFGLSDVGAGFVVDEVISVADTASSCYRTTPRPRKKSHKAKDQGGTPDYMCPEIIIGEESDGAADLWSLGVLLYEFLMAVPPFAADSTEEIFDNILRVSYPPLGADVSAEAADLISQLLQFQPENRTTALRGHPFFAPVDWGTILHSEPPYKPDLTRNNFKERADVYQVNDTDLSFLDEEFRSVDDEPATPICPGHGETTFDPNAASPRLWKEFFRKRNAGGAGGVDGGSDFLSLQSFQLAAPHIANLARNECREGPPRKRSMTFPVAGSGVATIVHASTPKLARGTSASQTSASPLPSPAGC